MMYQGPSVDAMSQLLSSHVISGILRSSDTLVAEDLGDRKASQNTNGGRMMRSSAREGNESFSGQRRLRVISSGLVQTPRGMEGIKVY